MSKWLIASLAVLVIYVLLTLFALSIKLAYGDEQALINMLVNPAVTQANIRRTICTKGWTAKVRPSEAYTETLKRKQMKVLGYRDSPKNYEEDHFIPLELGGHPTSPLNLWPQPYSGKCSAHVKDLDEDGGNKAVCRGQTTLAQARQTIFEKWIQCKAP